MDRDEQMLQVYRHDAHKVRGRSHEAGDREVAGVRVNLDVPYHADRDAAAMSRPGGRPEQTVDNHETHYRLSLLTGDTRYDADGFALRHYRDELHRLLATDDAVTMHERWLETELMDAFNEAVQYPYTSLKYHTLLVAALVDNYRSGATYDDLWLVVDAPDELTAHRTVYSGPRCSLRLTDSGPVDASATLGSRPWRSWASVWSRLSSHPHLDTGQDKFDMMLDANLRRIRAWSTALQYLEDYADWRPDK